MLPSIPPTPASLLLLPLYVTSSRTAVRLVGSGFLFTLQGRFFLVTAAHVASQFAGETMALRGPKGYILSKATEHGFFSTGGEKGDRIDLAVGEMLPPAVAQLGSFARFVDLPYVTQDFVVTEGMHVAFFGFPKTVNREIVARHADPRAMQVSACQVAFDHPIYKTGFVPPMHICAKFSRRYGHFLGQTPEESRGPLTSPHPDGMSGGLVFRLDETDYQRMVLTTKGIIGVGIEYHEDRDVLVGIHISEVFEMLRTRWPELSLGLPILNLENGTYALG